LNLGTHAAVPPIPGLAEAKPLTHVGALELDRVPEHLIVLGGGYVGLELAQAWRRLGSRVTITGRGERLTRREDEDRSAELLRILEAEGVTVLLSTEAETVEGLSGEGVKVGLRAPGGTRVIVGSDILVAAG